ncbi:uncharacterized protein LOC135219984 isoform X2 [Macrobrachium nipponense]|uniref:uncharacterized protein LOC135219984 isoform X2 n=1 Tax=Macrobrachium nipponense TaxID=159736 RepID=UPI0030C83610
MEKAKYQNDSEPYIPSWRAACDAWVTQKVEDRSGVHTPVYLLYNAYIKDNPDDYMDIGQFGKVLRSRFPYRKRRRGKQGQQVYVYQDVALKQHPSPGEDAETKSDEKNSHGSTQVESGAGPSIVVGNIAGGRLLPSSRGVKDTAVDIASDAAQRSSLKRQKVSLGSDYEIQDPKAEFGHSSSGDEKYGNTSLCRMAVGRRWIDANLSYVPGHDTYADEVLQAYLEDHPKEPLTYTSLALLIRGKYPGRRKKVNVGQMVKFVYKDLKLSKATKEEPVSVSEADSNTHENLSFVPVKNLQPHRVTGKTTERRVPSPSGNHSEQYNYHNPPTTPTTVAGSYSFLIADKPSLKDLQMNALRPSVIAGVVPSTSYQVPGGLDLSKSHRFIKRLPPSTSHQVRSPPLTFDARMAGNSREELMANAKLMTATDAARSQEDMNVSEYLENELLEINDLNKRGPNYTVSIQVPGRVQVTAHEVNPSFRRDSSSVESEDSACRGKAKVNPMLSNHPKYRKFSIPESDVRILQDYPVETKPLSPLSSPPLSSPLIPVSVSDMTREDRVGRKRSWDYATHRSVSPDPHRSWDYNLRKSLSPELPRNWSYGVPEGSYSSSLEILGSDELYSREVTKLGDNSRLKGLPRERVEPSLQAIQDFNEKSRAATGKADEVALRAISSPMNSLSIAENGYANANSSKGSSGSPTSSSPPGAAMHRLAEEIITSSPQVGEPSQQSMIWSPSSTLERSRLSGSTLDSHFKEAIKSVISAAKEIPMTAGHLIETNLIMRRMESAIIKENPAISYDEQQTYEAFSCSATSALKDLELNSPEHIIELIRHHQSCSGVGCTTECHTLRAAYVHLVIFRHKCSVWDSFCKIIAKHSRRCRILSCDVEFCHFVKHELHLNGISVLPMQLLKERPSLEEAFRRCEEMGPHDGELHCCHFPAPKLPLFSSPSRQLEEGQSCSDSQQTSVLSQTIVSAFPDTPAGNAVGMQVVKTLNLLRDLFKKFPDVR